MKRALQLVGIVVLSACNAPTTIYLPRQDAQAVIMVRAGASGFDVTAHAMDEGATSLNALDGREYPRIVVASYAESLEELGLIAGALHQDPSGSALPTATRVHSVDLGVSEEWQESEELPGDVRALRFLETRHCGTPRFTQVLVPGTPGNPTELVPIGPERLLLLTTSGTFFEITPTSETLLPSIPGTFPNSSAFTTFDGEVWLLGADGRTAHGHPDRGFVAGPPLPSGEVWMQLTGSATADLELYALSYHLTIARSVGGPWTVIKTASSTVSTRGRDRIAWAEPRVVALIGESNDGIIEVSADGSSRAVRLDLSQGQGVPSDALYGIRPVAGLGLIVGSRDLVLFRRVGQSYEPLPPTSVQSRTEVIVDLADGGFLAGSSGGLAHYRSDLGQCDPLLMGVVGGYDWAARQGELVTLVSSLEGSMTVNRLTFDQSVSR